MCSKHWLSTITFLGLMVLVCPLSMIWQAKQAYADSPTLDLQLDSSDAIRWDIGNITPGDSGLKPINLHNAGNVAGSLFVWIGDLADDEGANPESETGNTTNPGELSSYIYLDIINDGMTFAELSDNGCVISTELPISLKSFPGSSDRALCIADTQIGPGQTLELQWQWTLSPDAGNDVQGDTVSFSIYYSLFSDSPAQPLYSPPVTIPPPPAPSTAEVSENNNAKPTPEPDPLVAARTYVSADDKCVIYIPEGVQVMTGSGKELLNVIIDAPDDYPPAPEPFIFAGPVYRISGYTADGMSEGMGITPGVQLIIYLDTAMVPEDAEISVYSYHPGSGWVKLDCVVDPSRGWLTASVDYLGLVAILVLSQDNSATYLEPTTPASPVMPDKGDVSGVRQVFTQVSLGVALSGCITMIVLAYIQRRRRIRQAERRE